MGNICQACKDSKEKHKTSAFQSTNDSNNNNRDIFIGGGSGDLMYKHSGAGAGGDPLNDLTTTSTLGISPDDTHPSHKDDINNNDTSGGGDAEAAAALLLQQQKAQAAEVERQYALREEQARLELIVSTAGRDMVPVIGGGGGGGSTGGGGGNGGNSGHHHHGSTMAYYDPGYAASITQDLCNPNYGPNGGFVAGLHALYAAEEEEQGENKGNVGNNSALPSSLLGKDRIPETEVKNGIMAVDMLSTRIDFTESLRRGIRMMEKDEEEEYNLGIGGIGGDASGGGVGGSSTGAVGGSTSGGRSDGSVEFLLEDVVERFLARVFCTKEGLFQDLGPIVENLP